MPNKYTYKMNRYSEKSRKKDGSYKKLSDPFLAAREVSKEGGIDNFLDKHYQERRHHEWQQEDPYNHNLTLEEIKHYQEIEEFELSGRKSIFETALNN